MTLLEDIDAHLVASVAALKKVAGAIDFASAGIDLKGKLPAAYVLPGVDKAAPNQLEGVVLQQVATRFSIVLAISNLRDGTGKNAHGDLDPIRKSVIAALLGWSPSNDYEPVEFAGGRLLKFSDGVLWWQDEFTTSFMLRSF